MTSDLISMSWSTAQAFSMRTRPAKNRFAGLVRMLKAWAVLQDIEIKSLVMEVLALDLLGDSPNRPAALKTFFVEAAYRVESLDPIVDPADVCGEIQPDLDMATLAERLHE